MQRPMIAILTATFLLAPLALASEGPPNDPGLPRACERSGNPNPCRGQIPDTVVGPGEEKTYTGNWTAIGTVVVKAGGRATVVDASVHFEPTSAGFIAEPGATLRFLRSDLEEVNGSDYRIEAQAGSDLTLNDSLVAGGSGVKVATSAVNMSGNTLTGIATALRLTDVTATIHHNAFLGNTVAVNQTGGIPTLAYNLFDGGEVCVQDFQTDPNILHNVFRGCHIGIWHEQSESNLAGNDMADQSEPPGVGIWVVDGLSPIIEDNLIRDYGTGIRITNARAYVRNNTIETNVGHGILVESNPAPMDIQGNLVRLNGADGIRLVDASHIDVRSNTVRENAGAGITLVRVANVPLVGNVVEENAGDGIVVRDSPGATLTRSVAEANGGIGIVLENSPDATLDEAGAHRNAQGITIDAASLRARILRTSATGNAGAGIEVRADDVRIEGGSASDNGGNGLTVDHALDVLVLGLTANLNDGDGVFLGASRATLDGVNASSNGKNGFRYDPMGPFQLLGPTELIRVRGLQNAGAGLLNVDGNATSVEDGWWQGNLVAGIQNDDAASLIDARNNYWGSPTGPTHALNPLGTGDRAVGGVLYHPFRTAPP